jgi:3-hydroxybutyryl-CoA dehydrogenase
MATIGKNLDRQVAKQSITENQKTETLERINTYTDINKPAVNSDLIVEAASENFEIKTSIFKQIDSIAPAACILATNTSSISITKLAAATKRPEKVIGMHFMNPVPVMKLVEIIKGFKTEQSVCDAIVALTQKIQKVPTLVNDYPGFVSNRVLMPLINEAIYTLYEGIAGVNEIDTVMKLGMAHPMGPLQLADFIGLDVCYSIMNVLHDGFGNPKYAPCPLLEKMVLAGVFGVKSGSGFYDYSHGTKDLVVSKYFTV